ncbi:zonular occludens toxin domain-containing protein [Moraxella sp. Pampa]|uniref:zonular occludens toxin domain-containing protein n=1 Tax=Moraxella sp. Pampa TaxID=3111978 RepID=UPI002B4043AA|nr:zonular occludens toxin domain-containing protein [Moraxella sp. Pampa]
MIRLITATPGSGKTCVVVEWLLKEIDRGFYKEFYTNIEGLTVCGVRPLPDDCDWRKLNPKKSKDEPPKLVIIDECQYIPAFMKENRSVSNAIGKDLSTHRHYGLDIWFITQSTKLLNDYVLENVGEHVHLFRPKKSKNVQVYWWSYVQKSLTKSAFKDADDKQVWRLNPNMFNYYKSTSQVTDSKGRVSQKVVMSVLSFILILLVISFFVTKGLDAYTKMKAGDVVQSDQVEASANLTASQLSQIPLSDSDSNILTADDSKTESTDDESKENKDVKNDEKFAKSDDLSSNNHEQHKQNYYVPSSPMPIYTPLYNAPAPVLPEPTPSNVHYVSPNLGEPTVFVYNHEAGDCTVKNKQSQVISTNPQDCKNKFRITD